MADDLKKEIKKALIEYDKRRKNTKLIRIAVIFTIFALILILFGSHRVLTTQQDQALSPKADVCLISHPDASPVSEKARLYNGCSWMKRPSSPRGPIDI